MEKEILKEQKEHFIKNRRLLKNCDCENNCIHDENLKKWVNDFLRQELKAEIEILKTKAWNLSIKLDNKSYEIF